MKMGEIEYRILRLRDRFKNIPKIYISWRQAIICMVFFWIIAILLIYFFIIMRESLVKLISLVIIALALFIISLIVRIKDEDYPGVLAKKGKNSRIKRKKR